MNGERAVTDMIRSVNGFETGSVKHCRGDKMGFMDKLKALFKKKDTGAVECAPKAKKKECDCGCNKKNEPVTYASQFSGDSAVYKALIHAAEAIDKKVASGTPKNIADLMMSNLKAIQASSDPEDVKLIQISQVIGQVFRS